MAARKSPDSRPSEAAPRLPNGQFPRGVSGNPGGLPKGLAEVKELARQHTPLAIDTLVKIAENGQSEMARIAASNSLLDRGWGKPTQPLSGDADAPPIGLSIEDQEREAEDRRARILALCAEVFADLPANDVEMPAVIPNGAIR